MIFCLCAALLSIAVGTESLGVALLLLMFLYSNADSPNYTALVSIVAAYLVYSVYSFSSSVRRFVQTRTLGELLKRVETADKLAVSYAGSRNALDANQVMALDEHESSVLKYRQFKLKSLHGLRTAHYGGQFNRVWLDALPRLRVMWGLSDLTDALERSVAICNFTRVPLPGQPVFHPLPPIPQTIPTAAPVVPSWTPQAAVAAKRRGPA